MTLRVNGTDVNSPPSWNDLTVAAASVKAAGVSNQPAYEPLSGGFNLYTWQFDNDDQVFFDVQITHDWKSGTSLHPHVHWCPTVSGSAGETVIWGLEYAFAEIGGIFSTTTTITGDYHIPHDTALVQNKHYLTEIGEISMTGINSVSSMFVCRVFRATTDTYGDNASFLEFDFHYEVDSAGSDREYSKSF